MATGLDLTDEFVAQFEQIRRRCEKLESEQDTERAARVPKPVIVNQEPDRALIEQIAVLNTEITRLSSELALMQETVKKETLARQEAERATLVVRQELTSCQTTAERNLAELRAEIKRLETTQPQVTARSDDASGTDFEEAFPDEADELRRHRNLVYLYREKYGPII